MRQTDAAIAFPKRNDKQTLSEPYCAITHRSSNNTISRLGFNTETQPTIANDYC